MDLQVSSLTDQKIFRFTLNSLFDCAVRSNDSVDSSVSDELGRTRTLAKVDSANRPGICWSRGKARKTWQDS